MQYITHWPDMAELVLPKNLAQDLHQQLQEPFDSEASAKQFWQEAPSSIIILDPTDNILQLKDSDTWDQIEFALTYPEYTLPLSMGYQLSVAIVNDSGAGITEGMWTVGYFTEMRERHMAFKKKHPDRKETSGKPYEGISNLRPETKAFLEAYEQSQKLLK